MVRMYAVNGQSTRMANRSRVSAGPPSSTVASRLAPTLSSEKSRGRQLDTETFAQLLRGLLGSENDETSEKIVLEPDVNVNYGLICVVVDAGLETAQDDPFVPAETVQTRMLDSLTVLELAIRKTPEVLYHVSSSDPSKQQDTQSPTFVWLISKLLSLWEKRKEDVIQERLHGLFSCMRDVQPRCSQSWNFCGPVSTFLQLCIDGKSSVVIEHQAR